MHRNDERIIHYEDVNLTDTFRTGGRQKLYTFRNGYGASVIMHDGSYGGERGLWEVAVLKDDELCYDTEITSDVIGHLNDPEVDRLLERIANLKEKVDKKKK